MKPARLLTRSSSISASMEFCSVLDNKLTFMLCSTICSGISSLPRREGLTVLDTIVVPA